MKNTLEKVLKYLGIYIYIYIDKYSFYDVCGEYGGGSI